MNNVLNRVHRFLEKPFHEQSRSFYARWKHLFPAIPFPVRLPFGAWFIARNDYLGSTLTFDGFELAERVFVQRFLQPGMTVLDIGAHQGFYSLLASKLVGPTGKVFAFEPSPRERKALHLNLGLNGCKNVSVQEAALGNEDSYKTLYVVDYQTGCNSLKPPAADVPRIWHPTRVHIVRLDDWLESRKIDRVDFIKLDVEGGELEVLKGGKRLLTRCPRPVILAEVQDIRTQAWGYAAKEIIASILEKGYKWFCVERDGSVTPFATLANNYDGNFAAFPEESLEAVPPSTAACPNALAHDRI